MKTFKNTNEKYGDAGPFEATCLDALKVSMMGNFERRADEAIAAGDGRPAIDIIAEMATEFESGIEEITTVPVFENGGLSASMEINPDACESTGENAEPTNRCLSGTDDFWAAEEWREAAIMPDGRECQKYYLFAVEDITDDDGNRLEADCYPWVAEHVSRIVVNQE